MRFSQDNTETKLWISKIPEIRVRLFFVGTNFRGSSQKTFSRVQIFADFLKNREIGEN